MRHRASKDRNHGALKAAFEQLGCSVLDTHNTGIPGFPDIVVGTVGMNFMVEIKNPETRYGRAGLNSNQQAFAAEWRGGKLFCVSSVDEVAALVRNMRAMG